MPRNQLPSKNNKIRLQSQQFDSQNHLAHDYTATREYAKDPPQPQYQWNADQVHDLLLFMGNTGMRPDEVKNLQHRDVTVMTDPGSGQEILEIEVRGKRGIGFCKSTTGAVRPYQRLLYRPTPTRGTQKA